MDNKEVSFEELKSKEKEKLDELLNKEGKITGEVFHTQCDYIKKRKGEKGLDVFAQKAKEMGRDLDLRKIDYSAWYPIGLRPFSWLVMLEAFNWGKNDLINSGYREPRVSFVIKLFMRHFISLNLVIKKAPSIWKRHYTVGKLTVPEINTEENFLVVRIEDFDVSPLFCIFYLGYFRCIIEFTGKKNVEIKETSCVHRGGRYHEYKMTWK